MRKYLIYIPIFLFLLFASTSFAANKYVSHNGEATWGNCGDPAKTGIAACSLAIANSNADDDDIVYMRAGTYGTAIAPSNNGSSGHRIVYQNYNDEDITITGLPTPIQIGSHDYITISGSSGHPIAFTNCPKLTDSMSGADYNIFAYLEWGPAPSYSSWSAMYFGDSCDYNWIHHCTIHGYGRLSQGDDEGDMVLIGGGVGTDMGVSNLVENNTFYHGAHSLLAVQGKYTVVKDNYFHNEIWDSGYGGRCIIIKDKGGSCAHGWNLIDGNRIGFAELAPDNSNNNENLQMDGHDNIIRKNLIYYSVSSGIRQYPEYNSCNDNNYFYNNNFFYNGVGGIASFRKALSIQRWGEATCTGIVVKNNVFEDNIGTDFSASTGVGYSLTNNFWEGDGDPLFTDETIPGDETDDTLPDFTLQSSSPCIDGGAYLTKVNDVGGGSGTSLVVDDAHYFFSGDGSPWNIPSYTGITGDYIYIDNPSSADFIVEIASINYGTNTLTLASSQTWDDDAKVYLTVSSTIAWYGCWLDIGTYEYDPGAAATQSNPLPSGEQACTEDPIPLSQQIQTDFCTVCKLHATDVAYDSMGTTYEVTGGKLHTHNISEACGQGSINSYSRCAVLTSTPEKGDVTYKAGSSSTHSLSTSGGSPPDPPPTGTGGQIDIDDTKQADISGTTKTVDVAR